eukprot:TRINITY_DN17137_c0_g1_i1.p1 TRINITY_DN17137_c0_g1~~TRINITY_DN17137_c0_g1_i1.p1  ORF type:complete len:134 (-),score=13.80 TRINITY_DN17137_c0_g1_i1:64-465(-)
MEDPRRRLFSREDKEEEVLKRRWAGWYTWSSDKYWYLSDKLQAATQRSHTWSVIIRFFGGNPNRVALGIAEGTILCKLTFPVWGPLELWLILNRFKHRRLMSASDAGSTMPELGGLLENYSESGDVQHLEPIE